MKPRCGVSACLLGHPVRYDGSDKNQIDLRDWFGDWIDCEALCPEAEAGLGVPRPPIRWVQQSAGQRLETEAGVDVTHRLQDWMEGRDPTRWDGLILKARSPSCGSGPLNLYQPDGGLIGQTEAGIWVRALRQNRPELSIIDEEAWNDPAFKRQFLMKLFATASKRVGQSLAIHPRLLLKLEQASQTD